MKRKTTTAVIALLAFAAALGLAACGSDNGNGGGAYGGGSKTTTSTGQAPAETVETIAVRDGEPVGGVAELEYSAGEEVEFKVRSDVADEVHVHGYDISKDVEAGGTVSFAFPAELEGIFEVELEESAVQIAELRVNP